MELHFHVSGTDRKKMVEAISKELNTKAKYLGMPSVAYQIGSYTVSKDGSLSFEDDIDLSESSAVIDACVMAGFEPEEWAQNTEADAPEAELPKEAEETADSEDLGLTVALPRDTFTDGQLENLKNWWRRKHRF
ncbi:hypothetical protein NHG23_02525 [Aerococcaceae bacterium NML190073]|nr:hypothetical protein [Aerococcaceae bacterium NML190073]